MVISNGVSRNETFSTNRKTYPTIVTHVHKSDRLTSTATLLLVQEALEVASGDMNIDWRSWLRIDNVMIEIMFIFPMAL